MTFAISYIISVHDKLVPRMMMKGIHHGANICWTVLNFNINIMGFVNNVLIL